MPIDIDRFEDAEGFRDPPTSERIIRFLGEHDDQAYTRREIADAIGANPETVGTNLTRLKKRGLVRHREPYWAAAQDDATESVSSTETNPPRHREAAMDFFDRVRDRLNEAIDELYLFGSVARGVATADSDVDVLAVISDDADYATIDNRLLDIAYDVQLEYDVRIEVHSLRAGEFAARKERGEPFVRTVIEEGESGV